MRTSVDTHLCFMVKYTEMIIIWEYIWHFSTTICNISSNVLFEYALVSSSCFVKACLNSMQQCKYSFLISEFIKLFTS